MAGSHIDQRWLRENPDRVKDFDIDIKMMNEGYITKYTLSTTEKGKISNAYVVDLRGVGILL